MLESLVGAMVPTTRHAVVVMGGFVPAVTIAALAMTVSGRFAKVSGAQGAAAAVRDHRTAAANKTAELALSRSRMISPGDDAWFDETAGHLRDSKRADSFTRPGHQRRRIYAEERGAVCRRSDNPPGAAISPDTASTLAGRRW
jgi:hypothetical protein